MSDGGMGGTLLTVPSIDRNIFQLGPVTFEAAGDRVLVEEDTFRSGYECQSCDGRGYNICTECDGGQSKINPEIRCKSCEGSMKVSCEKCKGKGGLLVIPDIAQHRPATGTIVSIGEKVTSEWKRGQGVVYSSFAGNKMDFDFEGKEYVLKVLHQSELLCRVSGHLEMRRMSPKSDIGVSKPQNYDT